MTTASRRQTRRAWIIAQMIAVCLLIGAAIVLAVHPFQGSADGYTPPTTPGDRAPVKVGEAAPDFSLPNATGASVSLHDFRGKPLILVFFRTFG